MLTIRFRRVGKRNKAYFKLILQDKQKSPAKKHVEILGSYDPHLKKAILEEERIKYWLGQGVSLSDTVHNLLVSKGIVSSQKRAVKIPSKVAEKVAEEVTPVKATEEITKTEAPKEVDEGESEDKKLKKEEIPKAERIEEEKPAT